MAEGECVSASEFREAWDRWGGVCGGDSGSRVPLYCGSDVLCEVVRSEGVRGEEVKGDDSRSIAYKVRECVSLSL